MIAVTELIKQETDNFVAYTQGKIEAVARVGRNDNRAWSHLTESTPDVVGKLLRERIRACDTRTPEGRVQQARLREVRAARRRYQAQPAILAQRRRE